MFFILLLGVCCDMVACLMCWLASFAVKASRLTDNPQIDFFDYQCTIFVTTVFIIASVFLVSAYSIFWLVKKGPDIIAKYAKKAAEYAKKATEYAKKAPHIIAEYAKKTPRIIAEYAKKAPHIIAEYAKKAPRIIAEYAKKAADIIAEYAKKAQNIIAEYAKKTAESAKTAPHIIAEYAKKAADNIAEYVKKAPHIIAENAKKVPRIVYVTALTLVAVICILSFDIGRYMASVILTNAMILVVVNCILLRDLGHYILSVDLSYIICGDIRDLGCHITFSNCRVLCLVCRDYFIFSMLLRALTSFVRWLASYLNIISYVLRWAKRLFTPRKPNDTPATNNPNNDGVDHHAEKVNDTPPTNNHDNDGEVQDYEEVDNIIFSLSQLQLAEDDNDNALCSNTHTREGAPVSGNHDNNRVDHQREDVRNLIDSQAASQRAANDVIKQMRSRRIFSDTSAFKFEAPNSPRSIERLQNLMSSSNPSLGNSDGAASQSGRRIRSFKRSIDPNSVTQFKTERLLEQSARTKAFKVIQSHFSGHQARLHFKAMRIERAATLIQSHSRGHQARLHVRAVRSERAATSIQSHFRGHQARLHVRAVRAATSIQSHFRGHQARLHVRAVRSEYAAVRRWFFIFIAITIAIYFYSFAISIAIYFYKEHQKLTLMPIV